MEIFRKVTVLCYETGWTTGNIGLKYLKIVRNIIEFDDAVQTTPDETDRGTKGKKKKRKDASFIQFMDKINLYEIVSIAMHQILTHVNNNYSKKKTKDYYSCEEEIYLISEITKCCRLIIEKILSIQFIDVDKEDLKSKKLIRLIL